VGQQIGNYQLIKLLGEGGYARVYLGKHRYLNSHAALKVLSATIDAGDEPKFLAEAQALVNLRHANIVHLLDFVIENATPVLIMDYAQKGSLRQYYPDGTRMPLATVVDFVGQIAAALQYAHNHHVIHRDVKPENILLDADNRLLLSDFGLSLLTSSSQQLSTQDPAATARYMAPEQIRGKPCAASDQYALAVIVYEWLCGEPPFRGNVWEVSHQHLYTDPPPLRAKCPELPPMLEYVVGKALAKKPEERFVSVQAFAEALASASQASIPAVDDMDSPVTAPQLVTSGLLPMAHPDHAPPRGSLRSDTIACQSISNIGYQIRPVLPFIKFMPPKLLLLYFYFLAGAIVSEAIVSAVIASIAFFWSPHNPSAPQNIHIPNLQVNQNVQRTNQSYVVTVSLHSLKSGTPLSALEGSVIDGQVAPLSVLLGTTNTPCVAATLLVSHTTFDIQPSQVQEYSLQESDITWLWSITPLRSDQQALQEVPVLISVTGKLRCGSGEAVVGPYPLAREVLLTVGISSAPSVSSQTLPPQVSFLFGGFLVILFAFLSWLGRRAWQVRKRRRITREDLPRVNPKVDKLPDQYEIEGVQAGQKPFSLFYCYAHEDRAWCTELDKQLSSLKHQGWIKSWSDSKITPGAAWRGETMRELETAHIILLLISPDFISSKYCYDELMTRAIERHQAKEAVVVPILLRPSLWETAPFAFLQPLPSEGRPVSSWTNQDEAFLDIARGIHKVVASHQVAPLEA
jgi:serine/threonine protein kinase